ncbi:hypothetical protein WJX84_009913 [Apatococcus fuscideae]|uniref:Uncharacterized protein n=1 Tax=Apatococcus fuscideae TaxID=2026836 RepID=A0AAW1T303_9CHLO
MASKVFQQDDTSIKSRDKFTPHIGSLHEARWDTDVELVKRSRGLRQQTKLDMLLRAPTLLLIRRLQNQLHKLGPSDPWNNQAVLRRERHGFIVQGKIDPHRRNYAALIEGILQRPGLLEHPGFTLRLVGSAANADVDFVLAGKIWAVTDRSSFKDYWRELQSSLAIVPAFSNSRYLDSAASSTLFTSVLLGIPIIADDDILKTYSYLTKDDVLYQSSLETVYDVMARYVHASMHDDIIRISRNLIRLRNTQLRRNKVVFQRLIM